MSPAIRDAYVELKRKNEADQLSFDAASRQHDKDRSHDSHLMLLQFGASCSHSGGVLEGFTMALALLASRTPWENRADD